MLNKISAIITGGNLALITSSIGTIWEINTNNKILFLEDVGERGYKVDRMLLQLQQAGKFSDVKAIVFGNFSSSDRYVNYAIRNFAENHSNIPCYKTNKIGHGYFNYPIIYNKETKIQFKV